MTTPALEKRPPVTVMCITVCCCVYAQEYIQSSKGESHLPVDALEVQ